MLDMSTLDLNDLSYYAHVVEHGGFAPAGGRWAFPSPNSAVASPCLRNGSVSA